MQIVNIHHAKTNLSALLAAGKPFVIAKAGRPIYTGGNLKEVTVIKCIIYTAEIGYQS